jgi:hypothetical protein
MTLKLGFPELAAYYRDAAFSQYFRCSQCYDRVWGDLIPAEFASHAARIYAELRREVDNGQD